MLLKSIIAFASLAAPLQLQLADPVAKTVSIAPGVDMPTINLGTCCGSSPDVGPSRAKSASRSLRRALLMPQVNTGSLYRCSRSA